MESDFERAKKFRETAQSFRVVAAGTESALARGSFLELAAEYDRLAEKLESKSRPSANGC